MNDVDLRWNKASIREMTTFHLTAVVIVGNPAADVEEQWETSSNKMKVSRFCE